MLITPEHLMLEYGASNIGMWNMLGILDAKPSTSSPSPMTVKDIEAQFEDMAAKFESEGEDNNPNAAVKLIPKIFSSLAKVLVGRSDEQYGITSLMIFRQVAGMSTQE